LKEKWGLPLEKATEVLTWVDAEIIADSKPREIGDEPEWFSSLENSVQKTICIYLNDLLQKRGHLNDDVYKEMEQKCGLTHSQTEEIFKHITYMYKKAKSVSNVTSESTSQPTELLHDRLSTFSFDEKMPTSDSLAEYIFEIRVWRDPLYTGSWFLFGVLIWFLLVIGDTSVLSLFSTTCIFYMTICGTFVNIFEFWKNFVSTETPRMNSNIPKKENFQISDETILVVARWCGNKVNSLIALGQRLCSCTSNIDTLKALILLYILAAIGSYISGATVYLFIHCNFFLGELFWSMPTIERWSGRISSTYKEHEDEFREYCRKKLDHLERMIQGLDKPKQT